VVGGLTRGFWAVFEGGGGDLFCPAVLRGRREFLGGDEMGGGGRARRAIPTHDDETVMNGAPDFVGLGGVVGEGEGVAVGVFEPGYLGSTGGRPDAVGVLLEDADAEEFDAAGGEVGDGGVDVVYLPAEDGELVGGEGLRGADDAQHGLGGADAEDQGEVVVGDEVQAEGGFVEGARGGCVGGGDEGDGGVGG
jgi:hypothetical protein